jgi:peptidoglycan/LPS O-acetylase OafA/YrhL
VQQIPALFGIRILAALWVVVEHFRLVMFGLFPETRGAHLFVEAGYLGVEVFFVLSGFIISHNYAERFREFNWPNYRRFLVNRFARLYPVHLVTLVAVAAMVIGAGMLGLKLTSDGKYEAPSFFMNVLMLQAVPPAEAWNSPAWSISAEAGAYATFPLLALAVMRVRSRAALLVLTAGGLAVTIVGQFILEGTGSFSPTGYASIWFRIAGEFAAGCFLWRFWSLFVKPGRKYDTLAVLAVAGVIAVLAASGGIGAGNFLALPFFALFVLACASATGPVSAFLSARWMIYGGKISYSLYMVHFLVLMVGGKALPWDKFADDGWMIQAAVLAGYFTASLAGAALLYHMVEKPGRKAILKMGVRVPPRRSAVRV